MNGKVVRCGSSVRGDVCREWVGSAGRDRAWNRAAAVARGWACVDRVWHCPACDHERRQGSWDDSEPTAPAWWQLDDVGSESV